MSLSGDGQISSTRNLSQPANVIAEDNILEKFKRGKEDVYQE